MILKITHRRLSELLRYDPVTGQFIRLITVSPNAVSGSIVGYPTKKGYLKVYLDGRHYGLHNLAWFYMYRVWPADQIDHKDLDKTNNKIDNLREADNSHNKANSRLYKNNSTGYKNIRLHRPNGRFQAFGQGKKSLGYYATAEEAAQVAADYAKNIYGEFYREIRV